MNKRLEEQRQDPEKFHETPYNPDQKYISAQSKDHVKPVEVWRRLDHFFYNIIPDLEQKAREFISTERTVLKLMGLDKEESTPYQNAIQTAFGDGETPSEVIPFDALSYLFGNKHIFFVDHLVGKDVLQSMEENNFVRPEGEDGERTEYDRKAHSRIPGVIYSLAGHVTGEPTKGIYLEVHVDNIDEPTKQGILQRAIEIYIPFQFGQAFYKNKGLRCPYDILIKDLEWVIAILDSTQLPEGTVIEGQVSEEIRDLPVYGEGERDEFGYPPIIDREDRPVKFFTASDGRRFEFYKLSELDIENVQPGTKMKILLEDNHTMGYYDPAAAPFHIEKAPAPVN